MLRMSSQKCSPCGAPKLVSTKTLFVAAVMSPALPIFMGDPTHLPRQREAP